MGARAAPSPVTGAMPASRRTATTLRDVADAVGVHPSTVSRVLRKDGTQVATDALARRITEAAAALGYRPNPVALSLRTGRSSALGLLLPDVTNPVFTRVLRGLEDRLASAGYTTIVANTDYSYDREAQVVEALLARNVDGLVFATGRRNDPLVRRVLEAGVPVALINQALPEGEANCIVTDDELGVRLALEHLASLGHRRVGHLAGPEELDPAMRRRHAFKELAPRFGLDPDPTLLATTAFYSEEEGARATAQLLASAPGCTAILCGNDVLALGCYEVLAARGIACPAAMSVIGFNDMPLVGRLHPPLTTLRVPYYAMGREAGEVLLKQIQSEELPPPRLSVHAVELVVRGSTAPPRS